MLVIRTLMRHYRRHPVQALFLLTGIVVANVLLAGTLLINAQARSSYDEGERLLSGTPVAQIHHTDRTRGIDERDYVHLRRQGFDMLSPLLRQWVRLGDGQTLELLGIDVFAIPVSQRAANPAVVTNEAGGNFTEFAFPPYQVWAAPGRLEQLGIAAGLEIPLPSGETLPPLHAIADQQLGHRMLIDVLALQSLTGNVGKLSSILVFPSSTRRLADLEGALPEHLRLVSNSDAPDPQELTSSFHLNLAAMGLLAFVVGTFLTYNALAFSYTDRKDLVRRLRLAGVLKSELASALLLELSVFLVIGMLIGSWLGAQMASWLLPGVGQTLAQLYGVYISYPDSLVPSGFWLPVLMTVIAAVACVLFPLRETLNSPMLERRQTGWQQQTVMRRDLVMSVTGLLLLIIAILLGLSAQSLWVALTGMACLLLGAALLLPLVLRVLLGALDRSTPRRNARLTWLLADSRWLLGPASLALMALTLALVANNGLNTMIHSFRAATDDWLSQRLVADLYLRGQQELDGLEQWLAIEAPGLTVAERFQEEITRLTPSGQAVPVEVVSLRSGDRFRDSVRLMRGEPDAIKKFEVSEGIYISERAWRIDGWSVGNVIDLCENAGATEILGVIRDYGNPHSQWMVSRELFRTCWPGSAATGLSVHGPQDTDWGHVRDAITGEFGLEDSQIVDQTELRDIGLAVFDRTFVVTRALNALTLLVAAIGIFCAISAIHHHRVGQQALLSSLGLTRRERGAMLLLQWGILGLLCMVLVWPFGTMLAFYLGSVVTPVAFGWSFPLRLEWGHYLVLAALAVTSLLVAVLLPSLRLLRTSPAAMLREQNL